MKPDHECSCNRKTEPLNQKKGTCPLCDNEGLSVSGVTVKHLVKDSYRTSVKGSQYKICLDQGCDVVYYDVDNVTILLKDQIKVPIWFKKNAKPKYACYCSKVTEEQVIEAVKQGAKTVKEVNKLTGAMINSNCRENNPLGVCCHNIIQAIIDKTQTWEN